MEIREDFPKDPTQPSKHPAGYEKKLSPSRKSGCCGCGCFSGCLIVLLFLVGLVSAAWYFISHNARYIQHADTLIVWTYQHVARPKLIESFSTGMNEKARQQFLQVADAAVEKYLNLPPEKKQLIFNEAATALWYLWTQQILPPEKIPHLRQFAEELQQQRKSSFQPLNRKPSFLKKYTLANLI